MSYKNRIQVNKGYYSKKKYNTLPRFISYFYQIQSLIDLPSTKSVLEIGPGSKLVSKELQSMGYMVTTCDFDVHVNPDVVADVRNLPFEDFKKVIENFSKISKKYVIISLPNRSTVFEFVIKFPFIQTLFKKTFFDYTFQIPVKFPGFAESDQHYWEIDQITTKRSQVREVLNEYFIITKEFQPPLNKYHRFFILEKK